MSDGGLLELAWEDGQIVMRPPSSRPSPPNSHEEPTHIHPPPAKRPRNMSGIEPDKNIPSKDDFSGGSGMRNFSFFQKPGLRVKGCGRKSYDTESTLVGPSSLRPNEETPSDNKPETVACGGQVEGLKPSNVPYCTEKLATGIHQLGRTSSACSLGGSNDVGYSLRRRREENDEISSPSENEEEEPSSMEKLGATRKRKSQGHNASEKKRKGRINKRLKELHHLVPNSNNVDKASMLDDAITYIKTLQLQLQMMSMGQGLYNYMPQMMLQSGSTRHIQAPQLTPWHPLMGLPFGSHLPPGSAGCSSAPPPPTPAMFGLHRQLVSPLPTALPCAPSNPFVGGQLQVPVLTPASNMDQLASAPIFLGSMEKGHQNLHPRIS